MAGTLINAALHWVDDSSTAAPVARLQIFNTAPGRYALAQRGREVGGSLVPNSNGGYTIALGVRGGSGTLLQIGDIITIL